ncbi:MAG: hypothetical protein MUP22_14105 [Desulfobacterales bacterium]|nr:hypothetical protein [Desulfobacterales bacterium]
MSGSWILSYEEKQEMLLDANNKNRGMSFQSARRTTQLGTLDDYIDFLSENMELIQTSPVKLKTNDYKL